MGNNRCKENEEQQYLDKLEKRIVQLEVCVAELKCELRHVLSSIRITRYDNGIKY